MYKTIIEAQDISGNWFVVNRIPDTNSQIVLRRMKDAKISHPTKRIRAVDEHGRLVDLLP